MSVEAISWAFRQEVDNGGAKLLLVAIANHVGKDGVGFPGRQLLATDCSSKRLATVTENMKLLEARGLVQRFERRRGNGSKTSDWIVLAPASGDRGEMVNARPAEYPEDVATVAQMRRNDGTESVRGSDPESGPGSGTENRVGQVRISGGPEPLEEPLETEEPPLGSPPDACSVDDFRAWLSHHWATTGIDPPPEDSKAWRSALRVYGDRLLEGYTPEKLELAIDGAGANEWRRAHQKAGIDECLKATTLDELIADGRRARGGGKRPSSRDRWAAWVRSELPDLDEHLTERAIFAAQALAGGRYDVTPDLVRSRLGTDAEAA